MKRGKIVWEGISWFIVGIVADLGICLLAIVPVLVYEIKWVAVVLGILVLIVPFVLSARAVVREIRRQKALGLDTVPSEIVDPILGKLVRGDEPEAWEARVLLGTREVDIRIDGEGMPHPPLLELARALVADGRQFLERFEKLKQSDFASQPDLRKYLDEIRQLQIEAIGFYTLRSGTDVTIFLGGGKDDRSWLGYVVDGIPTELGFDT